MYLKSSFSLNTSRHNTRSGPLSLSIPSVKSFGLSSFNYTGPVAWNDLPGDIKAVRTKPMFKSKVKQFLFNKCLEQEENFFYINYRFLFKTFYDFFIYNVYYCLALYYCYLFVHVNPFCLLFYRTTMEISVFTFLCHPCILMYLHLCFTQLFVHYFTK